MSTSPSESSWNISPVGESLCYRGNTETISKNIDMEKVLASILRTLIDRSDIKLTKINIFADQDLGVSLLSKNYLDDLPTIKIQYPSVQNILDVLTSISSAEAFVFCGTSTFDTHQIYFDATEVYKQFSHNLVTDYTANLLMELAVHAKEYTAGPKNFSNSFIYQEKFGKFSSFPDIPINIKSAIKYFQKIKQKNVDQFKRQKIMEGWGLYGAIFCPVTNDNFKQKNILKQRFPVEKQIQNYDFFESLVKKIISWIKENSKRCLDEVILNTPEIGLRAIFEKYFKLSDEILLQNINFKKHENMIAWNPTINILDAIKDGNGSKLFIDFTEKEILALLIETN